MVGRNRHLRGPGRRPPRPQKSVVDVAWQLHLIDKLAPYGGWALVLLASAVPLHYVNSMVHSLAGKRTEVTVAVTASIVWGVAGTVATVNRHRKTKKQSKELDRLRIELTKYQPEVTLETNE